MSDEKLKELADIEKLEELEGRRILNKDLLDL